MTIEVDEITGRSAIRPIDVLYLELTDGPATVSVLGDAGRLRGNAESFSRLADEIDLFLEHNDLDEPGMHTHIEAPDLLAADSRELILAGPISDDQEWSTF